MAKKSGKNSEVVTLAKGSRHLDLYSRAADGEVLSAAEVRELERYENERPAAPAELPVHRAPNRGRKVSLEEVRALGLRSDSLTEAAAAFSGPGDLEVLIKSRDSVRAAWNRGRMLRDVRRLGATTVTVTQTGKQLGMTGPEFRKVFDSDKEVRELSDQERQALFVRTADTMVGQAAEDKPYAVTTRSRRVSIARARSTPTWCAITSTSTASKTGSFGCCSRPPIRAQATFTCRTIPATKSRPI